MSKHRTSLPTHYAGPINGRNWWKALLWVSYSTTPAVPIWLSPLVPPFISISGKINRKHFNFLEVFVKTKNNSTPRRGTILGECNHEVASRLGKVVKKKWNICGSINLLQLSKCFLRNLLEKAMGICSVLTVQLCDWCALGDSSNLRFSFCIKLRTMTILVITLRLPFDISFNLRAFCICGYC